MITNHSQVQSESGKWPGLNSTVILLALALFKFIAHMAVNGNLGYFRDTLYYIAAGNHLDWGYVEFPPFIAALAALVRWITGGSSLVILQIFPALAGVIVLLLTGLMAREFGGGRAAQALAGLASLATPIFLASGSLFTMDAFDELWWALGAYLVIRLINTRQPRLWLLFGAVAGPGLMTKIPILFFGFMVVVGLLLTPERSLLSTRWLWVGGGIAFLFILPYILWNWSHGWPTIEFWGLYDTKLESLSVLEYFKQQILIMNPAALPLWLAGFWGFFFTRQGKPYRALGWTCLILSGLFLVMNFKAYFAAPTYSILFAMGALVFERTFLRPRWTWSWAAYAVLLAVVAAALAPAFMPILSPAVYGQYYGFLGEDAGVKMERRQTAVMPQWLADRIGWENMVTEVARVYKGLPPAEQAAACIYTSDYGQAGAVDLFGPAYGLPPVICGHNNYYFWGPGNCTGEVIISLEIAPRDMASSFESGDYAGVATCSDCMPDESYLSIYVWRRLKVNLKEAWPTTKSYR